MQRAKHREAELAGLPGGLILNCGKWAVRIQWPVGKLLEVLPPTRIKCINYHTGLSFLVMRSKAKI